MIGDAATQRPLVPTAAQVTYWWFLRIVACYCLLFGVLYWIRLIGIYEGAAWRFDLMPVHWQVVSVTLAVLFPFAGIGLWMLASWGPVVWFICAAMETAMYGGLPALFGHRWVIFACHLLVAVIYIALRVAIHVQKRRAR